MPCDHKTERIGDLIERAGGLTDQAYPGGIQFYRSYAPGYKPVNGRPEPITPSGVAPRDTLPTGFRERVGIDLPKVLDDAKALDNVILAGGDSIQYSRIQSRGHG